MTSKGATIDVGACLRDLGLEQYGAMFRANAIEADVLRELTDQDFEKLGVLLGHRRRLLRAIAELGGSRKLRRSRRPPLLHRKTPPSVGKSPSC